MSRLSDEATKYLALRRALGHKLVEVGRLLPDLVAYVEAAGADTITVELAEAWAWRAGAGPTSSVPRRRWAAARGFAAHMAAVDPRTQVLPAGLIPHRQRRRTPYLYSWDDIQALMAQTSVLRSPLRAETYRVLVGLLAVTGMRVGEAIRLDRSDFSWSEGLLVIRESKFGKSRQLPLHPSTVDALRIYVNERDRHPTPSSSACLLVSGAGTRLLHENVCATFRRLADEIGLGVSGPRPRLHDLRHSFAVRTLVEWYRNGDDVEANLPRLSTYLGHVDPRSTYWYLSASPELLALAAARLSPAAEVWS